MRHPFLVIVSLLLAAACQVSASCIWYDDCYKDHKTNAEKACPYFGAAKILTDRKASDYLLKRCPNLFQQDQDGNVATCCSPHQIQGLKMIFDRLEEVAGDCPSCLSNMAHLFCGFTCSANQHEFMSQPEIEEPSESTEFEQPEDPTAAAIMRQRHPRAKMRPHDTCSAHSHIRSVDSVRVDRATIDAIVQSCAHVKYHEKNVFELIFAAQMTIHSLLNYIGNPEKNRNVAVRLGFELVTNTKRSLKFRTLSCNEIEPIANKSCPCQHCPAVCPKTSLDSVVMEAREVGENVPKFFASNPYMAGIGFIGFCVVSGLFLLLVLAYRIYSDHKRRNVRRNKMPNIVASGNVDVPYAMLVEHTKKGEYGDIVFTNDELASQRPVNFWQRLNNNYWAGSDSSDRYAIFEPSRSTNSLSNRN